ncbi:MAG: AMP-binding protein, partial [Alphaproteobacteria bacterium]|nr:AMP-binding protein [Alphaproteobacteria bacterium]
MQGLMQQHPLSIIGLMRHAALNHADTEIVSCPVEPDADTHRYGYADAFARMEKLASALSKLGVKQGDRVGTLAWNTWRHLELFYALPGMGAVCHTINPRLFEDQLVYIANHAEDRFLCLDITFVELVEKLADKLERVEGFIIMTDREHMPETSLKNVQCYEDLLAAEEPGFDWPVLDENSASSLCYTSGTTGNPKGVLYSHRSTVLHTYAACLPDAHSMGATTTTMPVAPMFHANAWGIPYCAAAVGAKMVLPGRDVSGPTLHQLILEEEVDHSVAVPTVWLEFLNHVEENSLDAGPLKMTVIGGTAVPESMYRRFNRLGVEVRQGWGMTELSPLG